jgi:histidinol-phosphate aminotransferase
MTTVAERERVRSALVAAGWPVSPSETNFLWMPLASSTAEISARCARVGVQVRVFADEGIRVSVGSPADNDALLSVLRAG